MRGVLAREDLGVTFDELLEDVLGVVGRLAHGNVGLAVS